MQLRFLLLTAAIALAPFVVRAGEILPGAKLDETSRDSAYINDATTAGDRAAERAMREKSGANRVMPEHRVVLRKFRGTVTTTDVYVIPNTDDPNRPPLY
ncbi:MAG: hypothetical protein ACAH83_03850 [Alphaproteobacteria bacterium]